MDKRLKNILLYISLLLSVFLFSGCVSTSGQLGRLKHDDVVKQTFESFNVPEGYIFYYSGPDTFPKAFIGISKKYVLDSSLWHPIELTSELLRQWIWGHAGRLPGDLRSFGSKIVGPDGEHIGVYYSLEGSNQWARVEMTEEGGVSIGGPIDKKDPRIFKMLFFDRYN